MDNIQEGDLIPQEMLNKDAIPALTPLPKIQGKPMTMDFIDAMKEILKGNKVTRVEWGNYDYCCIDNYWISIFTKGAMHVWKINDGDYEANDWVVVREANAAS